jgi:glycosyltransferase involved in cell wall biosynthesis
VGDHDFLVIASRADANPAVVLEAMAWGLVPVCTPESGYSGYEGIVNISATDEKAAAGTLDALQHVEEQQLTEIQRANWDLLDQHFHWSRFVDQIRDAIERSDSPPIARPSLSRRGKLLLAEISSPYFFLRPRQLAAWVK